VFLSRSAVKIKLKMIKGEKTIRINIDITGSNNKKEYLI